MSRRPLDEQFEPDVVERLRLVQVAFRSLGVYGRVSWYYLTEIDEAIDRGMLLSALHLASTLLEIWIRDLLVLARLKERGAMTRTEFKWRFIQIDKDIEGIERGAGFAKMIKDLKSLDELTEGEVDWLTSTYTALRNPIHHGISGRLVRRENPFAKQSDRELSREELLLESIFCPPASRRYEAFEEAIDRSAPRHLEEIVNFLADHEIPRLPN